MMTVMRELLGHAAIDWLPSVAIACLVIAAVHLTTLILRHAKAQSTTAFSSASESAAVTDNPVSEEPPIMEPQATLDSAASLERKGLMSSPPSTNAPKDLDMSEMVTRLSSNTATAGILAPRAPATSTQQYDQTLSKFQPNFPAQLNQAQVSNESSDRSQSQQEQQAGLQPTALRRVMVAGASAGCSRSGSEPPAFTPSSPANAAHNAYLVSISDDFVAPLSAFKEGIQPSNKSTKPAAAVAGGQKQRLAPVVSGSEESSATASRSSGGTSTDDNRSASACPSATEDVTAEPAAATDSGVPASLSSKPPCSPARIDLGAVRQQLQQHQLAQQQQAAGVSSVRKHQLLAAEPSSSAAAAGDTTAASDVPTAADVRPRRPSALYTSPMQHITVSVKVPNAFAPATARSLQNVVAQHVVSAAAAQQPPQHTIMHMVAVPGCIQLLIDVVNYQQAVQPTDSAPAVSASAAAAAASRLSLMTSLRDSVQSLYADAVSQASFDDDHGVMEPSQSPDAADLSSTDPVGDVAPLVNSSHAVSRSAAAASASGLIAQQAPAPPWMIKVVCEAVQEFMQSHACELTAAVNNGVNGAATSGADQAAAAAAEAAASAVAGNGSSNSNAFELVNASSQLQRSEAHADPTTAVITFNGESYRLLPAASSPGTPWQLQAIGSASEDNNGSSSRAAANTAWLRASGHGSDSSDLSHLLPPLMPLTAVHADAAAAAADDQAGDDHDQHDDQKWSLPDAIWVWPLCLAVQGDSSSRVDVWQPVTVPTSVSAASASASSVIQLHGLNGDSVRLVVTNAAGDVAADCICQLNKGVARIAPAASRSMSRCTIYCIAQPDTAPAASQTAAAAAAAGGGALECATVQFTLPVLYLPGSVVDELHEAARKIMLEQSRARWLLQHAAVVGTDAAADYYYCYLTDCLPESGGSSSGGASADATAEVGDCELGLATAAPRYGISSSSRIAGSHSRHVGSFATQPAPGSHTVAAAAAGWGTLFPELFGEVHQGQQNSSSTRQQQQQQGQSSSGNDGSGHGSSNSSKLTLEEEDAAHYVNLRGRLFDGVDVHQLLQEQFLAVLSDLGLLIDLTSGPTAAAAAAVRVGGSLPLTAGHDDSAMYVDAGLDRVTAVSGAAAAAASRVDASQLMAAAVGEQLLTWAGGCNCWFCCQLVLSMLLDLGVELVLQNTAVTRRHISTVGDVQALLLGHPANSDAAAAAAPTRDVALGDHASGVASAVSTAPSHDEIPTPLQQITAAKGPPANESASDVATVAPSQHQQRMHAFVESRLNNTAAVSSSDIPLHQWHSTAYATRRGRSSSRAADQTRASAAAAAAAAIAGNMPGSAALGHKKISVRTDVAADSHVAKPGHNAPVAAAAAHAPAVTLSTVNSNPGMNQEVSAADGSYAATRDQSRSFASVSSMPLAPPGCVIHTLPSVGDHPQSAAATAAGDADVNFGDQQVHNNRGSRKLRLSIKDSASEMIHRLMRRKLSPGEHKDEHSAQLGELSHTAAASTE